MTSSFTKTGQVSSTAWKFTARVLFSLLACLILNHVASAQHVRINSTGRKIVENSNPEYPKSLKEVHVGGLVRLSVTVAASGSVVKVTVVGGNPIFAESASKSVAKWKFAPAASQTVEPIQFFFNPN